MCESTLSGTKFDRFWVESLQKKLQNAERVETLQNKLVELNEKASGPELVSQWQDTVAEFFNYDKVKAEQLKQKAAAEEAKKANEGDQDWTKEEIALLTKGIVRFPPGTV